MESRSYFAIVGAFVIFGFAAILGFIVWITGGSNLDYDEYVVRFEGKVSGLQEAADVRFNGIKVGEVLTVRLDPDNSENVLVRIQVYEDTPVDVQSYAQLEPQGLTGLNFVQIIPGSVDAPLLKDQPGRGGRIIPGRPSTFDSLVAESGGIVESVQKTLNSAQDLLSERSIVNVERFLESIANIAQEYENDPITAKRIYASLDLIDQAAKDVSAASIAVDETAHDAQTILNEDVKPLITRVTSTLDKLDGLLLSATDTSDKAGVLLVNADGVVTRFEATSLQDIRNLLEELTTLAETLNRVAIELERNPAQFVTGSDREYVKVPQ